MKLPQKLQQFSVRLRELPKKYYFFSALGFGVFLYGITFFIPKSVEFSYAGSTCVSQLTLLPQLHAAADTKRFTVTFKDDVKLGGVGLVAFRTCFVPSTAPSEGSTMVATAPWGGIVARKHFTLDVQERPVMDIAPLEKPIPVSRPLELSLDKTDNTFDYTLKVGKQTTSCKSGAKLITCDIDKLALKQGVSYDYRLVRQFGKAQDTTLHSGKLTTLKAVEITKASVKHKQTIYSRPKAFSFTADKLLDSATVTLVKQAKEKPQAIPVTTEVNDKTLTVRVSDELDREATYVLTLAKLNAKDGSTLMEPKKITFAMSGGPKVVGVNIGGTKVDSTAIVTVQFDQALGNTNVASYISFKGGTATVYKSSATTVSFALQNLPLCHPFSLQVAAGLPSKYGVKSKTGWSFNSQTTCHTVATVGTSLQGRAIQSYSFGTSGPVTLFVGALHGNEASSSYILQDWIDYLETRGKAVPNRVVVVPTINPDGLAAGTRNNARNVNLNRNFPTDNWEKDIDDTNGYVKGGGGSKPLSEPEAKALASLTTSLSPRLLVSYHAVGSLVIGDPGGYSAAYAAEYAGMVGYQNATGGTDTFDYNITGAYEDWSYRNAGIPSMIVELGSYTYRNFNHHSAAMWAMLQSE